MTHAYARGGGEMTARVDLMSRAEVLRRWRRHSPKRGSGQTEISRSCSRPARRDTSPWCPDSAGPYRLPAGVRDRLSAALAGRKNRDAAFALAVFLARFWSSPRRLLCAIPVDRRPWPSTKPSASPKPGCAVPSRSSSRWGSLPGTSPRQARSTSARKAAFSAGDPTPLRGGVCRRVHGSECSRSGSPWSASAIPQASTLASPAPTGASAQRHRPGPCPHPKSPKSNP